MIKYYRNRLRKEIANLLALPFTALTEEEKRVAKKKLNSKINDLVRAAYRNGRENGI